MPIRKYRSLEEMNRDWKWLSPGDPAIARKIRHLWQLSGALVGGRMHIPRGVRKYRSIEEADADRNRFEQERVNRIRAEREGK
ncbi:MAG TPA: hypothetical protein VMU84_15725 [Thermoanaerobaculia bacterium]|nr:hypothetical protein [Thermoanaerobaculia bacterium]